MNDYMTPTHIDFIETYREEEHFKGYWFLTWIIGPERIVIWRKRLNAGWLLEAGNKQHFGEPNLSEGREVLHDGRVVARGESQKRLDSILEEHMHKTGQIGGPYEYWTK